MTIAAWVIVIMVCVLTLPIAIWIVYDSDLKLWQNVIIIAVAIAICMGTYGLGRWYCTSTASGRRAVTDQRSNLSNGIERTITVYTADGQVIAKYEGKIDIEMKEDYVKFDWNGKRYIYYNCFVETIAVIPN